MEDVEYFKKRAGIYELGDDGINLSTGESQIYSLTQQNTVINLNSTQTQIK